MPNFSESLRNSVKFRKLKYRTFVRNLHFHFMPGRRKGTRPARRSSIGPASRQLHANLVTQAAANHAYHASGLRNSEDQLISLGVNQKRSTVQPTSTSSSSTGPKHWVERIVEEALIASVVAA